MDGHSLMDRLTDNDFYMWQHAEQGTALNLMYTVDRSLLSLPKKIQFATVCNMLKNACKDKNTRASSSMCDQTPVTLNGLRSLIRNFSYNYHFLQMKYLCQLITHPTMARLELVENGSIQSLLFIYNIHSGHHRHCPDQELFIPELVP